MLTKSRTIGREFILTVFGFIAVMFTFPSSEQPETLALQWLVRITAALYFYLYIIRGRLKTYLFFRNRTAKLNELKAKYQLQAAQANQHEIPTVPENLREISKRDRLFKNEILSTDWRYADFQHSLYATLKRREYKAADIHYSFLELDLPRILPNMLFDAKKSHGRQFKFEFDTSQRHHLEGNFDTFFDTYFPKFYSIDALSIITPEVMHAMIDAAQYDIEIAKDKLYLYGPLQKPENIPSLIEKGLLIREKLLNNITTYRDERIDVSVGRQRVSILGVSLRKNPYKRIPGMLFALGLFTFGIWSGTQYNQTYLNEGTFYGFFLLSFTVYDFVKLYKHNKYLDGLYTNYQLPKQINFPNNPKKHV